MNHKLLLFLASLLIITSGCNKQKTTITGTVAVEEYTFVKLYEIKAYSYKTIDSVQVKPNGKFKFSFETEQPGFYQINSSEFDVINLLVKPQDHLSLTIDNKSEYTLIGNDENLVLKTFYDSLKAAKEKISEIEDLYKTADEDQKPEIEKQYLQVIQAQKQFSKGLIIKNLNSLVTIPVLYQKLINDELLFDRSKDLQFFKLAADSLTKYYPYQRNVKALQEDYNSRLSQFNHYKLMQSVENINAIDFPDFTYTDINGKNISLSKINKSNVLLFFWSTRNKESLEMIPHLKRIYNTFKNKDFTLVAIHVTNNTDVWKKAVAYEEMKWINVCDTAFARSKTKMLYNINSIPSNVLLNPKDKTIIAKDLTIRQLDSYLQDVTE